MKASRATCHARGGRKDHLGIVAQLTQRLDDGLNFVVAIGLADDCDVDVVGKEAVRAAVASGPRSGDEGSFDAGDVPQCSFRGHLWP